MIQSGTSQGFRLLCADHNVAVTPPFILVPQNKALAEYLYGDVFVPADIYYIINDYTHRAMHRRRKLMQNQSNARE